MSHKPRPPGTLYAVRVGKTWATEDDPYCDDSDARCRWTGSRVKALSILYEWRRMATEEKNFDTPPSDIRLVAILPRGSRAEAIKAARIEGMEAVRADLAFSYAGAAGRVAKLIESARKAKP